MNRLSTLFIALFVLHRADAQISGAQHKMDSAATGRPALADTLEMMERQSWTAWQQRDSAFFRHFLSEDHVELGFGGPTDKKYVVAGVGSPSCVVTSFSVRTFAFTQLTPTVAVLTYHAEQSTLCGGQPVPSPVWVSSTYVKRSGKWLNAVYQQTKTDK